MTYHFTPGQPGGRPKCVARTHPRDWLARLPSTYLQCLVRKGTPDETADLATPNARWAARCAHPILVTNLAPQMNDRRSGALS